MGVNKENMFGEFNEATQLKTSLAKYSIEFNDLAIQMRPHRITYLRLLCLPYTLLYARKVCGVTLNFFHANTFTFVLTEITNPITLVENVRLIVLCLDQLYKHCTV